MKHHAIFLLIILLPILNAAADIGQLIINEILVINTYTTLSSDKSEFPDWIELHNPTDSRVPLEGLYLTDDLNAPSKWAIPAHFDIAPQGFLIIYADGKGHDNHTNFKLGDSEEIGLFQSDGSVIDQLDYDEQIADVSYGRTSDSTLTWRYFAEATPGSANITTAFSSGTQCHEPQFSQQGGLYTSPVSLILTSEDNDEIRYTTDGSWPDNNSAKYSAPLNISQSKVIRAACFSASQLPSKVKTQTYILNKETQLPVLTLTTDPDYLFDEDIGITVGTPVSVEIGAPPPFPEEANYWQDWERPAHFAYYKPDGSPGFELNAGIKVFGGAFGVQIPQKAFSIYARSKYGTRDIEYQIFSSKSIDKFKRLTLRCSSNDFNRTFIRDAMMTSLLIGQMDIDYQAYEPAIMFVNGEYWGLYNIREKMNHYYAESNFGYDADDIDILEGAGEIGSGDNADYKALIDYVRTADLTDSTQYAYVASQVDIEEFINYYAAQFYFRNHDWPMNNIKWWRDSNRQTKWRWLLYDLDWGFGGEVHEGERQWETNSIEHALRQQQLSLLLIKLLENESFENTLIQRLAVYLQTIFETGRVHHFIDSLSARIAPHMPRHIERWQAPASLTAWDHELGILREFAEFRPAAVLGHLKETFELDETRQVGLDFESDQGSLLCAGAQIKRAGDFKIFPDVPFEITAKPKPGYAFSHWAGGAQGQSNPAAVIVSSDSVWIYAVFEPADRPDIVINEIHYNPSPEQGPDSLFEFIELVNAGPQQADLSGCTFSDGIDLTFPPGTTLKSSELILIVPDSTSYSGRSCQRFVYTDSKLSNGGEALVLIDSYGIVMDSVRFNDKSPWPESPDGKGCSLSLLDPASDNTLAKNWQASLQRGGTPGTVNWSAHAAAPSTPDAFDLLHNYPNPFNAATVIEFQLFEASPVELTIYNILGQPVYTRHWKAEAGVHQVHWQGCTQTGTDLPSGIYCCRLNSKSGRRLLKLMLTR